MPSIICTVDYLRNKSIAEQPISENDTSSSEQTKFYTKLYQCKITYITDKLCGQIYNNSDLGTSFDMTYRHYCTANSTYPVIPENSGVNQVVFVGSSTIISYININISQNISASLKLHRQGNECRIYSGHKLDKSALHYPCLFELSRSDGWISLTIWNTSLRDAGRYAWTRSKHNTQYSTQLVVLGM